MATIPFSSFPDGILVPFVGVEIDGTQGHLDGVFSIEQAREEICAFLSSDEQPKPACKFLDTKAPKDSNPN